MQNRVAEALEKPYEDLKAQLGNEPQLFMDESPTNWQANQKSLAVGRSGLHLTAVFAIFASRAAKRRMLPNILGDQVLRNHQL